MSEKSWRLALGARQFCHRSFLMFALSLQIAAADDPPLEWIDPATGHKIVRLSREPGTASLYFHQNAYSADGQKLLVTTPHGLSTIDLKTHAIDQVVDGRIGVLVTGRKSGNIYYTRQGAVYAADLETHVTREVARVPFSTDRGTGNITVNADETLLIGLTTDPDGKATPRELPDANRQDRLAQRWAAGTPMLLYTVNIKTGEVKRLHTSHDWLNHLQASPTDPGQIMFCHEGPWHFVDRIWLVRTDGTALTKVHSRTMDMEIAGHEFFSADGKTVWYDLQTPRSEVFWLAGYEISTGQRTWYHLERNGWSVHYNSSPDGTFFAGDGGGPNSVANRSHDSKPLNPPGNGQWIYLFRPEKLRMTGLPGQTNSLIKTGVLKSERLVDLSKHNYNLEPNVTFTPDGQWIVFRSNMHGATHVYEVEITKNRSEP
jgi:oligogalacturonide lyase